MAIIEHIVIIGWDGAGNFVQAAHTPNLDRLAAAGAFDFQAQTELPTISAQCWGSLLHGVSPEKHGRTNELAAKDVYPEDSPYPSIFRVAREAFPDAKLASFCAWPPINDGLIESSIGVHKVSLPDEELVEAAAAYITANPDFKLLFLALDLPDAAGHRHGYNTDAQLRVIEESDAHTGIVLQALESAGIREQTLIIAVSDHGGGGADAHEHGSSHPLDRTIFWGCAGPGVEPGAQIPGGITIKDTAAVVAKALGIPSPAAWEAQSPDRLLQKARCDTV